jgi:serine phosphatase RsbU (regulator of sigma subunit)
VIGAALASAVLALGASYVTAAGRGALAALDLPVLARLAVTQFYLAVLMMVALLMGQEAAGRVTAVKQRQAEQRERNRLQTLARLGELLAAALTPEQIGQITAAQVGHDAGAEAMALGLINADGDAVQWVHMGGYPPAVVAHFGGGLSLTEPSAATEAVRTGTPVLIGNLADYQQRYPQTAHWLAASGAASLGAWPLIAGDRPIGVLELMWRQPQPLDAAQRAYASAVATMVTQAVIRAQIYVDEHARAAVLQAAVLPAHPGEVAGLKIAVCYQPAGMPAGGVGGDWWDAMALPKERNYLAVGDVVGHGLPAVEDMAQLRAAGRALAVQGLPPAQLLAELNIFTAHATHGQFATMTVAIFDSTTGTLHYGSAGHPPALLRRAHDGEVIRLGGGRGPVLGPLRDAAYAQDQLLITPGDILVIYTDGLVERRGEDIDTAISQAQQHLRGWAPDGSLHDSCNELTATVAVAPRHDDVCVLAIEF